MLRTSFDRLTLLALLVAGSAADPTAAAAGPAPLFTCGDASQPPGLTASDALAVLRTAVHLQECSPCVCDADGSGSIAATDSLFTLKAAVGQPVPLSCPLCCEHCDCTPQTLTLTFDDVAIPCAECIPRVPTSNIDVDSIRLNLAEEFNGTYFLTPVAECVWEVTLPALVAEKVLYGSTVTDCTGSSQTFSDIDVTLQVVRTAESWEVYAGTYVLSLGWGDMFRATVESAGCDLVGSADNQNESCELAQSGSPSDYDTHGTGGTAELEIVGEATCH
ncbi:MAG TPA: hypothetical protein VEL28_06600 [Candidatus Binatia bacterium]|nr:hypothetical protein [Candidatus Binatia bacterium]